jgi:hypothetical protein
MQISNVLSNISSNSRLKLGKRYIHEPFQDTHFDRFDMLCRNGVLLRLRNQRRGVWRVLRKVGDCQLDDEKDSMLKGFGDNLYQITVTEKTLVLDIFVKHDSSPRHPDNDDRISQ